MDSLAPRAPGAHPAPRPHTGRHGKCRLVIHINGYEYVVRRQPPPCKGGRCWRLKKMCGPRAGVAYLVSRAAGWNSCTCPDFIKNKFTCKHVNALVACRLLSNRKMAEGPAKDLSEVAAHVAAARNAPAPAPERPRRSLPAPPRVYATTAEDPPMSIGARRTAAAIMARAALLNGSIPKGGDK